MKEVPLKTYARAVCAAREAYKGIKKRSDRTLHEAGSSPKERRDRLVAYLDTMSDAEAEFVEVLVQAGAPRVHHGRKIAKLLIGYYSEERDLVERERDAARRIPVEDQLGFNLAWGAFMASFGFDAAATLGHRAQAERQLLAEPALRADGAGCLGEVF